MEEANYSKHQILTCITITTYYCHFISFQVLFRRICTPTTLCEVLALLALFLLTKLQPPDRAASFILYDYFLKTSFSRTNILTCPTTDSPSDSALQSREIFFKLSRPHHVSYPLRLSKAGGKSIPLQLYF